MLVALNFLKLLLLLENTAHIMTECTFCCRREVLGLGFSYPHSVSRLRLDVIALQDGDGTLTSVFLNTASSVVSLHGFLMAFIVWVLKTFPFSFLALLFLVLCVLFVVVSLVVIVCLNSCLFL